MRVESLPVSGVLRLTPPRFHDERGFFTELWSTRTLADAGIHGPFVQENHSRTDRAGTVRGLHFQGPPAGMGKLVRVTHGRIVDVAVDLRVGSTTYGAHVRLELDARDGAAVWIPAGFAHGFATLVDATEVVYLCTAAYRPEAQGGLRWNDPALGIDWGVDPARVVLSPRDRNWPPLAALTSPFTQVRHTTVPGPGGRGGAARAPLPARPRP